jgi:hypothetical protein
MVKLNSQKIIQSVENNFLKKIYPFLKLVIMLKLALRLLKEIEKEFNFMKELLLLKKIV